MIFTSNEKGERRIRPLTRLVLRDAWLIVVGVLTLLVSTALLLRIPALPVSPNLRMNEAVSAVESNAHLVGGYSSLQEMKDRAQRFPSVQERVALYMSNWYAPPCRGQNSFLGPHVKYNFLSDAENGAPLLAVREIEVNSDETDVHYNSYNGTDFGKYFPFDTRKYSHSGSNRTFVLDSTILDKGARVFFLRANEVRRCNDHSCEDTLRFVFPSLYRVDMASAASSPGYPGNALDLIDGNSNHVVPVILQFGDMEVSRAFVPSTNDNETYPVIPIFKKFRLALPSNELCRVTTQSCVKDSMVPLTVSGTRRVQPIIAKFTYKRHYGMLEEIPPVDVPWHKKKDQAIFRGALTGMKRNGFRVVQNSATHSKEDMCSQIQRCKLVLDYHGSKLVNASLVDVLTSHPNNILLNPVVPPVLRGIELYGPRLTFEELLQYKVLIMLEGNDVSTGLKWALYSNSVVLTPPATYTSWAMEELLIPWVHYIPLNEDLSDVEQKVLWVLNNQEKAQKIARAGTMWISDLAFHPDSHTDESAILDEMLLRYKQHFSHVDDLSTVI